jgi:hypothetical protein
MLLTDNTVVVVRDCSGNGTASIKQYGDPCTAKFNTNQRKTTSITLKRNRHAPVFLRLRIRRKEVDDLFLKIELHDERPEDIDADGSVKSLKVDQLQIRAMYTMGKTHWKVTHPRSRRCE